jgi:hypothetical protein
MPAVSDGQATTWIFMIGSAFRAWERIRADGEPVVVAEEAPQTLSSAGRRRWR